MMEYILENEQLKVTVSDAGAEIRSIVGKKTGTEYLWQGDPTYWSGRAPVLFPICGRLTEGKYTWKGQTYEMNLHGFARRSVFTAEKVGDHTVTFLFTANEETKKMYPFDFEFRMTYTLTDSTVECRYDVKNEKESDLPFAVGGHPGFNVPMEAGKKFEDYRLEFACAKEARELVFSDTCFDTGKTRAFPLEEGRILPLRHSLFDIDAVFLTDMCHKVTLGTPGGTRSLTLSFKGFPHVGFWHKPRTKAPYVCIEPWCSVPSPDGVIDDFATKKELTHLKKGESYTNAFEITICE